MEYQGLFSTLQFRDLVPFDLLHLPFPRAVTTFYCAPELPGGPLKTRLLSSLTPFSPKIFLLTKSVGVGTWWERARSQMLLMLLYTLKIPALGYFLCLQTAQGSGGQMWRKHSHSLYPGPEYHLPLLFITYRQERFHSETQGKVPKALLGSNCILWEKKHRHCVLVFPSSHQHPNTSRKGMNSPSVLLKEPSSQPRTNG